MTQGTWPTFLHGFVKKNVYGVLYNSILSMDIMSVLPGLSRICMRTLTKTHRVTINLFEMLILNRFHFTERNMRDSEKLNIAEFWQICWILP